MGKRSDFERKPRDYYKTPYEAVLPLIPHLEYNTFAEPCAGDGALIEHLKALGQRCVWASDIEPQCDYIGQMDALSGRIPTYQPQIITNPPWDRKLLHAMIDHFRLQADTWLLFDSDWAFTQQASGLTGQPTDYLAYCHKIVSVGRISWEQNGTSGKDNCSWYLFKATKGTTIFCGPQVKPKKHSKRLQKTFQTESPKPLKP